MMERLCRSPTISFARDRTARCADMVFCGTSIRRASSPAGTPSGSRATSSRNVSSRVDWASAAKAAMTCVSSVYPDYQIYGTLAKWNGTFTGAFGGLSRGVLQCNVRSEGTTAVTGRRNVIATGLRRRRSVGDATRHRAKHFHGHLVEVHWLCTGALARSALTQCLPKAFSALLIPRREEPSLA
jgi:hypothetical protein